MFKGHRQTWAFDEVFDQLRLKNGDEIGPLTGGDNDFSVLCVGCRSSGVHHEAGYRWVKPRVFSASTGQKMRLIFVKLMPDP